MFAFARHHPPAAIADRAAESSATRLETGDGVGAALMFRGGPRAGPVAEAEL